MFDTFRRIGSIRGAKAMRLHQRGLELVVELLEAAERLDKLSLEEHRALLQEAAQILGDLLARDLPNTEPD